MRKKGLLHGEILKVIAELAHGDLLLIGDAGMPCPEGVQFIDLAVSEGVPGFLDVLSAVIEELKVEKAYIDVEQKEVSPAFNTKMLATLGTEFPYTEINHEDLKEMSKNARAMIRTGEFTSYANIILQAGVSF